MTFYKTISKTGEGLYTEKRSKFISYAVPVSSVEEAMAVIEQKRKEYYDARHVCWAYVIGEKEREERANDDGEPSSTAGKPILGQIYSHKLTNIVVIVIRYFGGVKLGTGGLIVAYREAAKASIENSKIIRIELTRQYKVKFPFEEINTIMRISKQHNAKPIDMNSGLDGYTWIFEVTEANSSSFYDDISSLHFLHVEEMETESI